MLLREKVEGLTRQKIFKYVQTKLDSPFNPNLLKKNIVRTFHFSAQVDLEDKQSWISGGGLKGTYIATMSSFTSTGEAQVTRALNTP